jgi:hypothetical protein
VTKSIAPIAMIGAKSRAPMSRREEGDVSRAEQRGLSSSVRASHVHLLRRMGVSSNGKEEKGEES